MDLSWFKPSVGGNVLITGCGGGYDIFTGLPIYFALKSSISLKSHIILGNLSFSAVDQLELFPQLGPVCYCVDAQ